MVSNILILNEDLIKIILQATPVGLCVTDRNGVFVTVNKAYADLYGYSSEEMIGKSFLMVVREQDREHLQKLHDEFIAGKQELDAEWTVQGKGGRIIQIRATARLFQNRAGHSFKVTMVQDITQRKMLERRKNIAESILFKEIAQSLESLKSRVHTTDWSPFKKSEVKIDYEKEFKEILDILEVKLTYLKDFSEIMSGNFITRKIEFDLESVFRKLELQFRQLAQTNDVDLVFTQKDSTVKTSVAYRLTSDPFILRNILENLIKNAIEASPPGARVESIARKTLNSFLIEVINEGEIPEAAKSRFFQPYNTTKSFGTGLGVYSAKLMSEVLGGNLKMNSISGKTVLSLHLPINILLA